MASSISAPRATLVDATAAYDPGNPFARILRGELAADVFAARHSEVFNRDTPETGLRIVHSGAVEIRDSDNKLLDRQVALSAYFDDLLGGDSEPLQLPSAKSAATAAAAAAATKRPHRPARRTKIRSTPKQNH